MLAGLITCTTPIVIATWIVDSCTFTRDAVDALLTAYRSTLRPPLDDAVEATLRADGLDPDLLFTDPLSADEVTTRADIAELAAAASVLQTEGLDVEFCELANVPKRSRRVSEHGADFFGASFDPRGHPTRWQREERLHIGSVKSSAGSGNDAARAAIDSLSSESWSVARVAAELRVFMHRLTAVGVAPDRLPLALVSYPDGAKITFWAVGVAATAPDAAALASRVFSSSPPLRRFRALAIDGFERIHERA
jgi:hypothetical protein